MPTKVYTLKGFSKGVNSQSDPTTLSNDEALEIINLIPDRYGKLRLSGSAIENNAIVYDADSDSDGTNDSVGLANSRSGQDFGFDFFYFTSPYSALDADDSYMLNAIIEAETEYWVVQDNRHVKVYDSYSQKWIQSNFPTREINLTATGNTGGVRAVYYYADGALRTTSAHPNFNGILKFWWGHIVRTYFGSTFSASKWTTHQRWYVDGVKIKAPTSTSYRQLQSLNVGTFGTSYPGQMNATLQTGGTFVNTGHEGVRLFIKYDDTSPAGTWEAKEYKFWGTYIYDGSQESPAYNVGTQTIGAANSVIYAGIVVQYASTNDADNAGVSDGIIDDLGININPRITGGRIYFSDSDDGHGKLYHMLDFDFENGCRKIGEEAYTSWETIASGQLFQCPTGVDAGLKASGFSFLDPPKFVTYETINGYKPDEDVNPKFKTVAIVGKRAYVGNVKIGTKRYNDKIIRSPINANGSPQYDTFPETHFLNIGAGDGDSITHLVEDSDKLLVFKKASVFVLNVGRFGGEFIEDKFQHSGIKYPSQVVKTEYGIVWVNENGCFLYSNGKKRNLIDNKIFLTGSSNTNALNMKWSIDSTNIPSVGYLSKEKKLVVFSKLSGAVNTQQSWIYDFNGDSWVYNSAVITSGQKSFFINDNRGGLYFTEEGTGGGAAGHQKIKYISSIPSSKNYVSLITKEMDFGSPTINKKIYKVGLSFKTDVATNLIPYYATDGNDYITSTFVSNKGLLNASGEIEATGAALSTQKIKDWTAGYWKVGSGGDKYINHLPSNMITNGTFDSNDTTGWVLSSEVTGSGNALLFDDTADGTADFVVGTGQLTQVVHTLEFDVIDGTGSVLRLEVLDDTATESFVTETSYIAGTQSVTFTPAADRNGIRFRFDFTGTNSTMSIDNIFLKRDTYTTGIQVGIWDDSPSFGIIKLPGGSLSQIAGVCTYNQTSSGTHYITPVSEQYTLSISTGGIYGGGFYFRLIDIGPSSTDLPDLDKTSTYDSNNNSTYPTSVPIKGLGVGDLQADYAELTEAHQTYDFVTASALNSSNRYFLLITVNEPDTNSLNGGLLTSLIMKDLGNWHTGNLDFTSPITCKSFQFKLESNGTTNVPESFELRSVQVYYRELRPKVTDEV